jgi:hypothetical protein
MTVSSFYRLARKRGAYHFIVAVDIIDPSGSNRCFTNAQKDFSWSGRTYAAIPLQYTPPGYDGAEITGGVLDFGIMDDDFMRYLDGASNDIKITAHFFSADPSSGAVPGTLGAITEIGTINHQYGTINSSGDKLTWNLKTSGKIQMQANPWTMDSDLLWR